MHRLALLFGSKQINPQPNFDSIRDRIQELYSKQNFQGALELAGQHAADFPEHAPLFYYWRMNFAAHIKEFGEVLRLFKEFVLSGQWFGEVLLRGNPAFGELQGSPEFEALVQKNLETAEADLNRDFPLLNIRPRERCETEDDPCPLLLVLHDNGGNPAHTLPLWQPPAQFGWLVAAPRSSQAMWKDAFVWDDREIAMQEIAKHLVTLQETYAIDKRSIVIAGSGTGAETGMLYALTHIDQIAGFIALNPAGPLSETPSKWDQTVVDVLESLDPLTQGVSGAIMIGHDEITLPLDNYRTIQEKLLSAGIDCALMMVEDAPPGDSGAYDEHILRALQAIAPRS